MLSEGMQDEKSISLPIEYPPYRKSITLFNNGIVHIFYDKTRTRVGILEIIGS